MSRKTAGYQLLDCGDGEKLEQVATLKIVRPCQQALWAKSHPEQWFDIDARFTRTKDNEGQWSFTDPTTTIHQPIVQIAGLHLTVKFTSFGHLGIFPEQQDNWYLLKKIVAKQAVKVLNLFAYTGGSSFACASAGAQVTHVDASKTAVSWAHDNARLNVIGQPIRWLTDDARKFVNRELRRGNFYDAVILDPPTFGRGPKGEVWKLTEHLRPLLFLLSEITRGNPQFILLTAHSPHITPLTLANLLTNVFSVKGGKTVTSNELSIRYADGQLLPAGASCLLSSTSLTKLELPASADN